VALTKKLLLTVLILSCFCYEQSNCKEKSISQSQKADLIKEADEIIAKADSISGTRAYPYLRIFAEVEDEPTQYVEVKDTNNWPENTITAINVIYDEDKKPLAYIEIPISESGDWYNVYGNYYNQEGKITVFKRYSGFFNSECVDSVLKERTLIYYDAKFNKIDEKYELYDQSDNPVDSTGCVFYYRFDYKIYKTFSKTPLVKKGILK